MTRVAQSTLQAELIRVGLFHAAAPLSDRSYAPPRLSWLTGEFDAWYRTVLARLSIAPYVAESGDCDDYSALYATLAKICHRRSPGSEGSALPVGFLHYTQETGGGHAVVVALTSDAGLVVIEPQIAGKTLLLTPKEKASAWLLVI